MNLFRKDSNMTREVKEYICASIDEGKTLQQIVDGIEEIFNTHTTKQNVSKFCNQYREKYEKDLETALDVVNTYIRDGFYNHLGRTELLRGISLYKVKTYLNNYEYLYDSERAKFFDEYCRLVNEGKSLEEIKNSLSYKGIAPSDYVLGRLKDEKKIVDKIDSSNTNSNIDFDI